jgi:hypothetical protein
LLILVVGCTFPVVGTPRTATAADVPTSPALPSEASDPFLVSAPGRALIFTTNAGGANVPVWSAATAAGPWSRVGDALPVLPAWAQPGKTWAPGVVRATTGAWLLFFSAWDRATGLQCIGRAVAQEAEGPYQPTDTDRAFLCYPIVGGSIDPSPFLDPWDEHLYLYWKNDGNCCGLTTSLWGLALTPDGQIGGPLVELLAAGAPWETGIVERPAMVRWASGYDLFYSGGRWATPWYGEGWARCDGPLGPCARQSASRAWLDHDDVSGDGPGGMSIATGPDGRLLAAWHAWPGHTGYENGGSRRTYVGALTMPEPGSATSQPLLHALDTDAPSSPLALDHLAAPSGFTAVTPRRVLDTRQPGSPVPRLTAGAITTIALGSVPALADADAVTANFTVTGARTAGYVRVWPCDRPEPDVSAVNVVAGVDAANGLTVGLAKDNTLCVRSTVDADLVIDVSGRWAPFLGARFTPVVPTRVVDTRTQAKTPPDGVLRVALGSVVPAETSAVALNVTATRSATAGYVTAWPCDQPRPDASMLNVTRNVNRANNVMLPANGGAVCLATSTTTDLIVDVTGYFGPTGSLMTPVQPVRITDTRLGRGDVSRLGRDGTIVLHVGTAAGLPPGTDAVVVNVTATDPSADGFLTAYPCGDQPDTSTLNMSVASGPVPNGAVLGLSNDGDLCVDSSVPVDVIVDLLGYLSI